MAIIKRVSKDSKSSEESASCGRDCLSGEFNDAQKASDEEEDVDSGIGSDCVDMVELEEDGRELCRVGDSKFLVPNELYELPGLSGILSINTWNDCLTEEDRFALSEFLPDMDQDTFVRTLKELLSGANFHFGSPLASLFDQMKGGLCKPEVALYRQGLNFLEKRKHYYFLLKYQNTMVGNLLQIKEAWGRCAGYGIEERLQLLNIMRSQKVLIQEKDEEIFTLQSETELGNTGDINKCLAWGEGKRRTKAKHHYVGHTGVEENLFTAESGRSVFDVSPFIDSLFREESGKFAESSKHKKQNPKGILKVAQNSSGNKKSKKFGGNPSPLMNQTYSVGSTYRPPNSLLGSQPDPSVGYYDAATSKKSKGQVKLDGFDGGDHEMPRLSRGYLEKDNATSNISNSKSGKKRGFVNNHDVEVSPIIPAENEWMNEGSFRGNAKGVIRLQQSSEKGSMHYGEQQKVHGVEETLMTQPQFDRAYTPYSRDTGKKVKHSENKKGSLLDNHMRSLGNRFQHTRQVTMHSDQSHTLNGSRFGQIAGPPFQQNYPADDHNRIQDETFMLDHSMDFDDQEYKNRKKLKSGKIGAGQVSKVDNSFNWKVKSSSLLPSHLNYPEEVSSRGSLPYPSFDRRSKMFGDINKNNNEENGGDYVDDLNDITESDDDTHSSSSEHVDEELETNVSSRKVDHRSQLSNMQLMADRLDDSHVKANKLFAKIRKESPEGHGRWHHHALFEADPSERSHVPKLNIYTSKGKQKAKTAKLLNGFHDTANYYDHSRVMLDRDGSTGMLANDTKKNLVSERNGQIQHGHEVWSSMHIVQNADKKHKIKNSLKYLSGSSRTDYHHSYEDGHEDDLHEHLRSTKLLKICQKGEIQDFDYVSPSSLNNERLQMPLHNCKPVKKKKSKVEAKYVEGKIDPGTMNDSQVLANSEPQVEHANPSKKRGKKTTGGETGYLGVLSPEERISEKGPPKDEETKLPKKSSTLIKPSVLTGFSFSIIHLLSAVRTALITVHEEQQAKRSVNSPQMSPSENAEKNLPSLSVQEIVNRVRLCPGDPAILKTQEPLQDLVRGVLKMFSAKTAPLGAKAWKPLASYERASKSWSWIGPLPKSCGSHFSEVETSPDAWGISHNMLGKLVDFYANWLKNGQETLQQIGSLPAPPPNPLPYLDEKERFKDLRAQKSLTTITPSSDEARAYFRKEEYLRYTVPDRAFAYTAADGCKSVVAPLRRCGGKPTSKARDHFMLKPDRPPHVTVLCLVRDAAARLPGSIGTRADVCTLLRDSQYIVEDVSDAQVNQVVSGALDRLHYELDPCVQFDADRKLWVYLHRDREDEDFEDDGTSSTKKWKRQKKEGTEATDQAVVNDASYRGSADQIAGGSAAGFELSPDLNAELSPVYSSGKAELVYNDLKADLEDNVPFIEVPNTIDTAPGSSRHSHPMGWEVL